MAHYPEPSLASRLSESKKKKMRPSLDVSARVDFYAPHGETPSSWRKEERDRLEKEIKETDKIIKNFNPKSAADQVLRSLKTDLAVKKARLMEVQAKINGGK